MKHAKMFAIIAVAAFCISAFAIAIDTQDSSAADGKLTYSFYLELRDGSSKYSTRLGDVTVDGTAPTSALYTSALSTACTAAGITADVSAGYLTSITADEHSYVASPYGDWGKDTYKNFAVYYYENNAWKTSNLDDRTMLIIVFDLYKFSDPQDASKWYKNEYPGSDPYWTPLPTVEMVEYKVYFQCKDGDHSFNKWTSSIQPGISGNSLKSARALGAAAAGFEIVNGKYASGMTSLTADNFTYTSHGTYKGEDYYAFATYCKNGDKNEWKDLQSEDLTTATIVAHVFDLYKFSDPKDDSYYYHAPVGSMDAYWTKKCNVSPTDDGNGSNNLALYIGIGAVAVVAIAVVAFFMLKKKA